MPLLGDIIHTEPEFEAQRELSTFMIAIFIWSVLFRANCLYYVNDDNFRLYLVDGSGLVILYLYYSRSFNRLGAGLRAANS